MILSAVVGTNNPDGTFLIGMIILWWLILQGSGRDKDK